MVFMFNCTWIYISDQANTNYDVVLDGQTRLEGKWVNSVASIAFPLGENIFVVASASEKFLKMVKIRVTGESTFDWMEAKYQKGNTPAKCTVHETFSEDCFVGTSAEEPFYSVVLVAKQQESKRRKREVGTNCKWIKSRITRLRKFKKEKLFIWYNSIIPFFQS